VRSPDECITADIALSPGGCHAERAIGADTTARCDSGEDKNEQSVYVLTGVAIEAFGSPYLP
jgi:hypothetical protein